MNIQTVTHKGVSFVNVINPGLLEVKYLRTNFEFDILHLDDYINKTQVPKIETAKNYNLIVLDFPYFNPDLPSANGEQTKNNSLLAKILHPPSVPLPSIPIGLTPVEKKRRIFSSQVDFFIGKDYLIILHDGSLTSINDIFSRCQAKLKSREEFMAEGPVFLAYRIIDALVDACFVVINELTTAIDKIDRELEDRSSESTIEDISVTRRNIVVFQTMIKPIIPLFKQLEEGVHKELDGSMQSFWSNVLDHAQKIWDRLEDTRELIEGISASNESYLTSRTNEIIKVLTLFSAVILPLTLLASIYGMNIEGLPLAGESSSLILISIVMFGIATFLFLFFKAKRWF